MEQNRQQEEILKDQPQEELKKKGPGPRTEEEAREEINRRLAEPKPWYYTDNSVYDREDYKALIRMYSEMPMSEVKKWAEEVNVKPIGELEKTFRMRVMYALQFRIFNSMGRPISNHVRMRAENLEIQASIEAADPVKAEQKETNSTSLSKMICLMVQQSKTKDEIKEAAVLHKKYAGNPAKARSYVDVYLKYMVKQGLINPDYTPTEKYKDVIL